MSNAGAVTLKIAVAVSVDPMAMRLRMVLKKTTNQTEFTGVCVIPLIFARNLNQGQASSITTNQEYRVTYFENGRASSLANA